MEKKAELKAEKALPEKRKSKQAYKMPRLEQLGTIKNLTGSTPYDVGTN